MDSLTDAMRKIAEYKTYTELDQLCAENFALQEKVKELEDRIAKSNEVNMGLVDQRDKLQAAFDGMEPVAYGGAYFFAELHEYKETKVYDELPPDGVVTLLYTKPGILP